MFADHVSLQFVHLRMEHQVNRFMGCDYNIEGFWRVMKDRRGAGGVFPISSNSINACAAC